MDKFHNFGQIRADDDDNDIILMAVVTHNTHTKSDGNKSIITTIEFDEVVKNK